MSARCQAEFLPLSSKPKFICTHHIPDKSFYLLGNSIYQRSTERVFHCMSDITVCQFSLLIDNVYDFHYQY